VVKETHEPRKNTLITKRCLIRSKKKGGDERRIRNGYARDGWGKEERDFEQKQVVTGSLDRGARPNIPMGNKRRK